MKLDWVPLCFAFVFETFEIGKITADETWKRAKSPTAKWLSYLSISRCPYKSLDQTSIALGEAWAMTTPSTV